MDSGKTCPAPRQDNSDSLREKIKLLEKENDELKNEVKECRKKENKFLSLIESNTHWLWEVDSNGVYTFVSPSAEQIMGYHTSEIIGKTPFDFMPPAEAGRIGEIFSGIVSNHDPIKGLVDKMITKKGREIIFETNGAPFFDDNGDFAGYIGSCRDITELKKLEEAHLISEERYRTIFRNSPLGIFRSTIEGRFLEVNPALAEVLGYDSPEEVIENIYNIAEQIYVRSEERETIVSKNISEPDSTHHVNRYRRKDGSEFVANLYLRTIKDASGNPLFLEGIVEDITEKKEMEVALIESEQKFRLLSDLSPVGIYQTDEKGDCIYANKKWLEMAGLSLEEALGKGWIKAIHPEDRDYIGEKWYKSVQSNGNWGYEYRFHTSEGKTTWVYGIAKKIMSSPWNEHGYLGINTDISNRKEMEEALRKSEEQFRKSFDTELIAMSISRRRDGKYLYANPGFYKMTGCSEDEVIGSNSVELCFFSSEQRSGLIDDINSAGNIQNREMEFRVKSGEVRSIILSIGPVSISGQDCLLAVMSDITDRKKMEEHLKIFKNIVSSTQDGISFINKDYKYTIVNDAYETFAGDSRENLIGKSAADYLGYEFFQAKIKPYYDKCLEGDSINYQEWMNFPKIGRRCVDVSYFPYRDSHGKIAGIVASTKDITERQIIEDALRESEEKLKIALEGAVADTWELDLTKMQLTYSDSWLERMGYDPREITHSIENIEQIFHPDDLKRSWEKLNAHLQGETDLYESEARIIKKDGEIMWILSRGRAVSWDKESKPIKILGVNFDITDIKKFEEQIFESEERYRMLFENAHDAIFVADPDTGMMLDSNDKGLEMIGRTKEELRTMHQSELHPKKNPEVYKERFLEAVNARGALFTEMEIVHRSGRRIPVEISSGGVVKIGEKRLHFGIFRDISKRKKAEIVKRKTQKRLKRAEKIAHLGHYEIELSTGKATWSDGCFRIFGIPEGSDEPTMETYKNMIHPDDVTLVYGELDQCVKENRDFNLSYRIIRLDGQVRYVRSIGSLIDSGTKLFGSIQDITELKLVENALKDSEAKFRTIFDKTPLGIALVELGSQKILQVNSVFCEITGYSGEELLESDISRLTYSDDWIKEKEILKDFFIKNKTVYNLDKRYIRKDGSLLWVRLTATTIRTGESELALGIVEDISERKQAEDAMKKSEWEKSLILNSMEEMFTFYEDKSLTVKWANKASGDSVGMKSAELIGSTCYELWQNREEPCVDCPVLKSFETGLQHEDVRGTPNGDFYRIRSYPAFDDDGLLVGVVEFGKDVTEHYKAELALKESEERMRLIIESSKDLVIVNDKDLRYTYFNGPPEYGIKSEDLIGKTADDFHVDEMTRQIQFEIEAVLKNKSDLVSETEMEWNGKKMWFHNYRYPIKNESGEVKEVASVCRNISDLKRTEKKLLKSLAEKELLVKEVHHRVKNNLQMIHSLLNLQSRKFADDEVKSVILESQNRIRSIALIHEKLYRSDDLSEINCREYVESLASTIKSIYNFNPANLSIDIIIDDLFIGIDKAIPYALLVNELITNSLKHAFDPGDKGKIVIKSGFSDEHYYLSVEDDGKGLPDGFDIDLADSFGLQLVTILTEQLEGKLEISGGKGTRIKVVFK